MAKIVSSSRNFEIMIWLIIASIACAVTSRIPNIPKMCIISQDTPEIQSLKQSNNNKINIQQTEQNPVAQITVYTGYDSIGVSHKMTFKSTSCQDLPEYLLNRTKSVNTHGTCVQLCEYKNCGGKCLKFHPGSPSHNNLRHLRFHKRAKSASPCTPNN